MLLLRAAQDRRDRGFPRRCPEGRCIRVIANRMDIRRGLLTRLGRLCWTATAFSIFLAVTAVHAQPTEKCDTLVPAQGQIEYRWRQNRCEGFYRSNVSSGDLELVSLLVGRLAGETTRILSSRLSCQPFRAPSLGRFGYGPSRFLPAPTIEWTRPRTLAGALLWPLGEVLGPAQLSMERVGVFGWVDASPERVFVPLRVV